MKKNTEYSRQETEYSIRETELPAVGRLPSAVVKRPSAVGTSNGERSTEHGYTMTESNTIFIIEDDADVLSIMVKHLTREGYEVITAVDGMEALKKLETENYDLVITDIVMPYVSGVGVVGAIKEKKPGIPVIAITGFGKEPEAAAMEKKADLVLAKPVKMSLLKDHIETLLSRSKGEKSS